LFWDTRTGSLDLVRDHEFVCGRLLQEGGLAEVKFLRSQYGDAGIRSWMLRHQARGMDASRIRFWQLLLKLPERVVSPWLRRARRGDWPRRAA
jgi:hypothetical protein